MPGPCALLLLGAYTHPDSSPHTISNDTPCSHSKTVVVNTYITTQTVIVSKLPYCSDYYCLCSDPAEIDWLTNLKRGQVGARTPHKLLFEWRSTTLCSFYYEYIPLHAVWTPKSRQSRDRPGCLLEGSRGLQILNCKCFMIQLLQTACFQASTPGVKTIQIRTRLDARYQDCLSYAQEGEDLQKGRKHAANLNL